MTIEERKEREKEQRRQEILEAAEQVFFENGYASAVMDQIAEKAEVSKGTLYLYFSDKEDLYYAICYNAHLILKEYFEEAIRDGKTGKEKSMLIGRAYFRFAREHASRFNNMILGLTMVDHHEDKSDGYVRMCHEQGRSIIQLVADVIEEGKRDGSIRTSIDPMELAIILWGETTGMIQVLQQSQKHIEEEFDVSANHIIDTFFTAAERGFQQT